MSPLLYVKHKMVVVKAGALYLAIAVALIVALLTSSLILIAYHHRFYQQNQLQKKAVRLNMQSGINYILASESESELTSTHFLDLFGEEIDSVRVEQGLWGIFNIGKVRAWRANCIMQTAFLCGYFPDKYTAAALYLVDRDRPLTVSGKTKIKGTCYLPSAGIRTSIVEGRMFEGATPIMGKQLVSEKKLPAIDSVALRAIKGAFAQSPNYFKKQLYVADLFTADSIICSFNDTTCLIADSGAIYIGEKYYGGNILFLSHTRIQIEASAQLNDVLVMAPVIEVANGFKGTVQLLATDSVIIGENCIFGYPSVAGLMPIIDNQNQAIQPILLVKKNTSFNGVVFSLAPTEAQRRSILTISTDAHVIGQLFTDGFAEIRGKVDGSVVCAGLLLRTPAATYENTLLDANIDQLALSSYFVGSTLLPSKKGKKIIQWLP